MSHIEIHDVSARARARLGRTAQITALEPRASTTPASIDWNPQRRRTLLGLHRQQFRPNTIELGEIILSEQPGDFPSDGGAVSSRAQPVVIDYSRQRSYVLTQRTVANQFVSVTTPPIPFGFTVTQCSVTWHGATATVEASIAWNLLVLDNAPPIASADEPSGEKLLDPLTTIVTTTASGWGSLAGSRTVGAITTGPLGKFIAAAGKRLAFVVQDVAGGFNSDISAIITVAPITGGGGSFRTRTRLGGGAGAPPPPTLPPGDWEQIF